MGAQHDLGYRSETTIETLTHLRARQYDTTTSTFTTTDPLPGINGATTLNNPYHYTNNNPLNLVDPSGMSPRERFYLSAGGIGGSGMSVPGLHLLPFKTPPWFSGYRVWHDRARDDLARLVHGETECGVRGGGKNGGYGRVDVCIWERVGNDFDMVAWEVKYFGPNGPDAAEEQISRYERAYREDTGQIFTRGPDQVPTIGQALDGTYVLGFSAGEGIRYYLPLTRTNVLDGRDYRGSLFRELVEEGELANLYGTAGLEPPSLPPLAASTGPDLPWWAVGGAVIITSIGGVLTGSAA